MTSANRAILMMLLAVAVLAGFWFVALGPKRDEANELGRQVRDAKAAVAAQKQAIATALDARRNFSGDYQQLVLLGKAVPEGDDTASLLVEVNEIASRAGVQFRQLALSQTENAAAAPVTPAPPASGEPSVTDVGESGTTVPAAPATESAAASLPIGATVGSAGLAVMPYELQFEGDFFEIANFLAGIDRLVERKTGNVAVDGRLITIDGFSLSQNTGSGFPSLKANLLVTTYVTPPGEGLTGGASPTAPAPTGAIDATTTSTTTSTATTTPNP